MGAQQLPAPSSVGVAHVKKLGSTAADGMLSLETAQGTPNIDVGVPLTTLPQASVNYLRSCAPTSRTCTTIAVITFAAVAFLISVCARHLKLHLDISETNQTRHLAAGRARPCYPPTPGGFRETADSFGCHRQIQALSIHPREAIHLTDAERNMVTIARERLVNLSSEIDALRHQVSVLDGSNGRLQGQLRATSRAATGPLRKEIQKMQDLIENNASNRRNIASKLGEKQRLLEACAWNQQQEVDALLLMVRDHTRSLPIGAARALAATKVVIAEGMRASEGPTLADRRTIKQVVQETLANAALLSGDLQTQRSSSLESINRGKIIFQMLDNLATSLPLIGLQDHVREVRVAKENLRGVLSMAADANGTGYMERGWEGNDPQQHRDKRSSTIVRRHTITGGSAYPPRSSHGAVHGTLPRHTSGRRHEGLAPHSGAGESTHLPPGTPRQPSNASLSRSSLDLHRGSWAPVSGAGESTHLLPGTPRQQSNVPPYRSSLDLRYGSWAPASGAGESTHLLPGTPHPPSLPRWLSLPRQYRGPLHQPQRTLPQVPATALPKRLPQAEPPLGPQIARYAVSIAVDSPRDNLPAVNQPLPPAGKFPLTLSSSPPPRPKFSYPSRSKGSGNNYMKPSFGATSAAEQLKTTTKLPSSSVVLQKKPTSPESSNERSPGLTRDVHSSPSPGPSSALQQSLRSGKLPAEGDTSTPSGPRGYFPGSTEGGGASEGDDLPSDKNDNRHPAPADGQKQPGSSSPPPVEPSSSLGGQPTPPGEDSPPPNRPPFTKGESSEAEPKVLAISGPEMVAELESFAEVAGAVASDPHEENSRLLANYREELFIRGLQLLQDSEQVTSALASADASMAMEIAKQKDRCLALCFSLQKCLSPLWMGNLRSQKVLLEDMARESSDRRKDPSTQLPTDGYVSLLEKINSALQETQALLESIERLNAPPVQSQEVSDLAIKVNAAVSVARGELFLGARFCARKWREALELGALTDGAESLSGTEETAQAGEMMFEVGGVPDSSLPASFLREADSLVTRLTQLGVNPPELGAVREAISGRNETKMP